MAVQLGQAGVDINAVLAGRQQLPPQLQHATSGGMPPTQAARLPSGGLPQQQQAPPPQGPGWQGQAPALNPGSREFRPGQQQPGARGMVRNICVLCQYYQPAKPRDFGGFAAGSSGSSKSRLSIGASLSQTHCQNAAVVRACLTCR